MILKSIKKLNHILEGKNTYVTAPWNKGAVMSKYDKLLILNDDIWMDWQILNTLYDFITPEIGLIGLDETPYNTYPTLSFGLQPIEHRNGGWGCALFVHKDNYTPIPEEMKVWGQDDWLFVKARNRRKQNYKLVGYRIDGELSVTNNILDANTYYYCCLKNNFEFSLINRHQHTFFHKKSIQSSRIPKIIKPAPEILFNHTKNEGLIMVFSLTARKAFNKSVANTVARAQPKNK